MKTILIAVAAFLLSVNALALDHSHKAWEELLKQHVKYVQGGNASRVDYAGFAKDRAQLKAVLDDYSKVGKGEFDSWTKPQQQAFLINAYNAFTVELILTKYPDLKSIRDRGGFVSKPWSRKFFKLFGQDFVAEKLDAQLDDAMKRFLSDRSRNRYNSQSKKLEVSRIFDWYGKDFERGHKGYASVKATMARYAGELADKPEDRAAVRDQKADVGFLEYDWALNDAK